MRAILLSLALSGCAVFNNAPYDWQPSGKPGLDRVVWEQRPMFGPDGIQAACGFSQLHASTMFAGCMLRLNNSGKPYCLVLSSLSEAEARRTYDATGMTHYEHEAEYHCRKGLNHG